MGKYSVPENIRSMKPKGTMVKNIGNRFYVYRYSCRQEIFENEDGTKRRKTVTKIGKCIGRIEEGKGFLPNKNYVDLNKITVKNFGDYEFAYQKTQNIFSLLNECFSHDMAQKIYIIALIFSINKFTYMTQIKNEYELSSLSNHFDNIKLGYKSVHSLYQYLGSHGLGVQKFEQTMIRKSSKEIAVDGHVISCSSEKNDLSEYGFKAEKLGTEQINWIAAYDVNTNKPLLTYFCPGSVPDKISIQTMLKRHSFENTKFILDRGFNSEKNKQDLSQNGNTFVIPMLSNQEEYPLIISGIHHSQKYFFYTTKQGANYIYFFERLSSDKTRRHFAFRDQAMAAKEENDFIQKMHKGDPRFTEEKLLENKPFFGVFVLETNDLTLSAEDVFKIYKKRWSIETYYNYVKNDFGFEAICQQDYFCMQGLSFIVLVASLIYQELSRITEQAKLSLKESMKELKKIKTVFDGQKWEIHNITKISKVFFEKVKLKMPVSEQNSCPT